MIAKEVCIPAGLRRALQRQLLIFDTGFTRSADRILQKQTTNIAHSLPQLHRLRDRDLAGLAADGLRRGDISVVGEALRGSWEAKRGLAEGVSTRKIDTAVEAALMPEHPAPK